MTCHECHEGSVVLKLVLADRLVKRCSDCGHVWYEPRDPEPQSTGKNYYPR